MAREYIVVSGCILVSREESDRWLDDTALRGEVEVLARRLRIERGGGVEVTTEGGYLVDVWSDDHWQVA